MAMHQRCVQRRVFIAILVLAPLASFTRVVDAQCGQSQRRVVSCVDGSHRDAQKIVLRVDGKAFYPIEIQIRLDKLRYYWGWDAAARDAIVARAAADGFNTISVPIHWYEVEPRKGKFDWSILDEYLSAAQKHGLRMEVLWFGQNSGGHVQWLGDSRKNPVHLRTPDYVLYSPGPESSATVSEFRIQREMSNYTLDLTDKRLRQRETYVLGRVMAHIASWDAAHGSKHTVVGVQLDNEVRGIHEQYPASVVVSYMSAVGAAVKKSPYVVWTRLNCVYSETDSRIDANESLRAGSGTHIDFVGIDSYRRRNQSADAYIASMPENLPNVSSNYRMIMECGAELANAAIFRLAALYGNTAMDYYDMISPDQHGLYDRDGTMGFVPHGSYVSDVRVLNKILGDDLVDVATKEEGKGLFVHNWSGKSTEGTTGAAGIVFSPSLSDSQAISIVRSNSELVLMNTKGGTFEFPSSLHIKSATTGYFDGHNSWVAEGSVPFTSTSISPPLGTTARLIVVAAGRL